MKTTEVRQDMTTKMESANSMVAKSILLWMLLMGGVMNGTLAVA